MYYISPVIVEDSKRIASDLQTTAKVVITEAVLAAEKREREERGNYSKRVLEGSFFYCRKEDHFTRDCRIEKQKYISETGNDCKIVPNDYTALFETIAGK